jgi:ATP-dependent exoDNAse (exonuclease V) alpha subunit
MNYNESVSLFYNANANDRNILLHGPAGTGKTHLLKDYISCLEDIDYYIVAPTGIAAINIGGETIHRTFGIPAYTLDKSGPNKEEQLARIIKVSKPVFKIMDLLIIDEISMVGADLLTIIDGILRKKFKRDAALGGVKCIFSGDFYQLSPVKDTYCFLSTIWQELNLVHVPMLESKRYGNDATFQFMLRLRCNKLTNADKETFRVRNAAFKNAEHSNLCVAPVQLYSYNKDVDSINLAELAKISEPEYIYDAYDNISNLRAEDRAKYIRAAKTQLNDSMPTELRVKKSANIVFVRNCNFDRGLVNGRLATIIEISHPGESNRILTKDMTTEYFITVQLLNGEQHTIFPYESKTSIGEVSVARLQYPFKLAWALTNYKAQGMSLDTAIVDVSNSFSAGQTYTTLSRVRDIDNIYISRYNLAKIIVSPDVASRFD